MCPLLPFELQKVKCYSQPARSSLASWFLCLWLCTFCVFCKINCVCVIMCVSSCMSSCVCHHLCSYWFQRWCPVQSCSTCWCGVLWSPWQRTRTVCWASGPSPCGSGWWCWPSGARDTHTHPRKQHKLFSLSAINLLIIFRINCFIF